MPEILDDIVPGFCEVFYRPDPEDFVAVCKVDTDSCEFFKRRARFRRLFALEIHLVGFRIFLCVIANIPFVLQRLLKLISATLDLDDHKKVFGAGDVLIVFNVWDHLLCKANEISVFRYKVHHAAVSCLGSIIASRGGQS